MLTLTGRPVLPDHPGWPAHRKRRHVPRRVAEARGPEHWENPEELRDTVQQLLSSLPSYLETAEHSLNHGSAQAIDILDDCQIQVARASEELRHP